MAAGIATLSELAPGRYDELEKTAAELADALASAAADAGRRVATARVGSLLTVFFRPSLPLDATEALASDRDAYARFFGSMLDQGILLPPSQFEAWFVSMAHGRAEVAATIAAARVAFAAAGPEGAS
jgi:glutamate-1-semialdehyde 2,1-aminomutase